MTTQATETDLSARLAAAEQEIERLRQENARLRGACNTAEFTCLTGEYCQGCQARDASDFEVWSDRELLRTEVERLREALAAADARADMLDDDLGAALDVIAGAIWTEDENDVADDDELIAAYEEHFGARLLRTVVTARDAAENLTFPDLSCQFPAPVRAEDGLAAAGGAA